MGRHVVGLTFLRISPPRLYIKKYNLLLSIAQVNGQPMVAIQHVLGRLANRHVNRDARSRRRRRRRLHPSAIPEM